MAKRTGIFNRLSQLTNGMNEIAIGDQVNSFHTSNVDEFGYWDDVIILKQEN